MAERHPSGTFFIRLVSEEDRRPDGTTTFQASSPARTVFTISGFITDSENVERLIGANVYILNQNVGTVTNNYGFYSITLPSDSVSLRISYIGYQSQYFSFDLQQDIKLDVELARVTVDLDELEVVAERNNSGLRNTRMGTLSLPIEQVKQIPALLGESDIIKALQLLPGVLSGYEGSSGLYVRGGGPDQNLILLDGAPVYNASHIFGFFSVFNPDALQHVQLTKGGFPARYGGRLSSVVDISMKEGNLRRYEIDGAVGLIFSKVTVQGPLLKDRMSFLISGRRTYLDVVTRPFLKRRPELGNAVFHFGDFNAKLNYIDSPRSRIYLSFYSGQDAFGNAITETSRQEALSFTEKTEAGLGWGNITGTARWN